MLTDGVLDGCDVGELLGERVGEVVGWVVGVVLKGKERKVTHQQKQQKTFSIIFLITLVLF